MSINEIGKVGEEARIAQLQSEPTPVPVLDLNRLPEYENAKNAPSCDLVTKDGFESVKTYSNVNAAITHLLVIQADESWESSRQRGAAKALAKAVSENREAIQRAGAWPEGLARDASESEIRDFQRGAKVVLPEETAEQARAAIQDVVRDNPSLCRVEVDRNSPDFEAAVSERAAELKDRIVSFGKSVAECMAEATNAEAPEQAKHEAKEEIEPEASDAQHIDERDKEPSEAQHIDEGHKYIEAPQTVDADPDVSGEITPASPDPDIQHEARLASIDAPQDRPESRLDEAGHAPDAISVDAPGSEDPHAILDADAERTVMEDSGAIADTVAIDAPSGNEPYASPDSKDHRKGDVATDTPGAFDQPGEEVAIAAPPVEEIGEISTAVDISISVPAGAGASLYDSGPDGGRY